jgi:hypothetical protein
VPIDFFLERVEDPKPRVRGKSCAWNGHKGSSRGRWLVWARLLKIPVEEALFSAERLPFRGSGCLNERKFQKVDQAAY